MTTMTFDTLQYANKLKAVGVPDRQAEVQAETLGQIVEAKLLISQKLEIIESEFNLKKIELKTEIIKWAVGISIAQTALVISCLALLH